MKTAHGARDRLFDLLADRAGGEPLAPAAAQDLDRLLRLNPEVDEGSFERAAAAIHLALMQLPTEGLPTRVRERILDQADSYLGREPQTPRPHPLSSPWLGWLAAAAVVLLLVTRDAGLPASTAPAYDEMKQAANVLVVAWAPTEDSGGAGVTGDVVWDGVLQTGYMRFRGLPENDPQEGQYQLWIFDGERPAEYPVDGVFDSTGGDTLVPIDAKIGVAAPTLFAITYERPGGVVVSTRDRLLLTATPQ